jgi:hypothetical protein
MKGTGRVDDHHTRSAASYRRAIDIVVCRKSETFALSYASWLLNARRKTESDDCQEDPRDIFSRLVRGEFEIHLKMGASAINIHQRIPSLICQVLRQRTMFSRV